MSSMLDTLRRIAEEHSRAGNETEVSRSLKMVNSSHSFVSYTPQKNFHDAKAGTDSRNVSPKVPNSWDTDVSPNRAAAGANETNEIYELTPREQFEERAGIIQYEAGVPRDWAEGFAQLCTMVRPNGITVRQWQRLIDSAGVFLDRFASQAAALGWDTGAVFGCSPVAPVARLDMAGLVFMVDDGDIIAITATTAKIRKQSGSTVTYTRSRPTERQVAIWELQPLSGSNTEHGRISIAQGWGFVRLSATCPEPPRAGPVIKGDKKGFPQKNSWTGWAIKRLGTSRDAPGVPTMCSVSN